MKRITRSLAGILILVFSSTVSAQKNSKTLKQSYKEFSLRSSLTSFFDYDAGIMLGVNYRWSEHFSASFEPTWIFYNSFITAGEARIVPSGIKIRADVKYHFPKRSKKSLEAFVAPEFHYKYTKTEKEDLFGINCQNGQCAFFQEAVYKELKNEIGGLLKAGIIAPLTFISKQDRLFLEIHSGLGVKHLRFRETDLPVGGSFVNPPDRSFLSFGNITDRNTSTRPMLPFGLKLFYIL